MNGNGGPPGQQPANPPYMEFMLRPGESWRNAILAAAAECGLEVVHQDESHFRVMTPTVQDAWSFGAACQEFARRRSHSSKAERPA